MHYRNLRESILYVEKEFLLWNGEQLYHLVLQQLMKGYNVPFFCLELEWTLNRTIWLSCPSSGSGLWYQHYGLFQHSIEGLLDDFSTAQATGFMECVIEHLG